MLQVRRCRVGRYLSITRKCAVLGQSGGLNGKGKGKKRKARLVRPSLQDLQEERRVRQPSRGAP